MVLDLAVLAAPERERAHGRLSSRIRVLAALPLWFCFSWKLSPKPSPAFLGPNLYWLPHPTYCGELGTKPAPSDRPDGVAS